MSQASWALTGLSCVALIHCTCGSWEGENVTSSRSHLLVQSQETTAVKIFGAWTKNQREDEKPHLSDSNMNLPADAQRKGCNGDNFPNWRRRWSQNSSFHVRENRHPEKRKRVQRTETNTSLREQMLIRHWRSRVVGRISALPMKS